MLQASLLVIRFSVMYDDLVAAPTPQSLAPLVMRATIPPDIGILNNVMFRTPINEIVQVQHQELFTCLRNLQK